MRSSHDLFATIGWATSPRSEYALRAQPTGGSRATGPACQPRRGAARAPIPAAPLAAKKEKLHDSNRHNHRTLHGTLPGRDRKRVFAIVAASSGNLVEWFDFYIYAFCAIYFAPSFFPKADPTAQLLNTAGVFAAGLPDATDRWLAVRPHRGPQRAQELDADLGGDDVLRLAPDCLPADLRHHRHLRPRAAAAGAAAARPVRGWRIWHNGHLYE